MTNWLYLSDSYLREFEGRIIEVKPTGVVLNQSAFYPGGGGQPSDQGTLFLEDGTELTVSGLKREDGAVTHLLESSEGLAAGFRVRGRVDWRRRYQLMRTHTAMHILCGVIWRDYGAQVTGGNMTPCSGRLDFELESLSATFVAEVEEKINREVEAAREVEVAILPREEAMQIPDLIRTKINLLPANLTEIRTVNITGLDLQADGGTHVANTKEVGRLKIPKCQNKGKHNKRLYVELEA